MDIEPSKPQRPHWGSKFAFVLAAAGSAIGLGNIWKFPYVTGKYGGGAFVLVYLLTILLVGLPLMAAEIMVGKSTQLSPIPAFKKIKGERSRWRYVGVLTISAAFLILSYYSVVAGWTLHYLYLSVMGKFVGEGSERVSGYFSQLYANGSMNLFWHFIVMVLTTGIIWRGLKGGIEKSTKFLMPLLFVLLLVLLVNSLLSPGAAQGIRFLFYPDFSKLNATGILEAVGQGFFSLSLGMGAMMTYGSYLQKDVDVARPAIAVVGFDTLIALLAGLVIFPIVFSHGLEPASGPGLVFQTLPVVFSKMPGGYIVSILFFLLLFVAALTSAISLLEVGIAYVVDSKIVKRHTGSLVAGGVIFLLGIFPALSGGLLADVRVPVLGMNLFDSMDYLASNWLLPMGGLLIAAFCGWAFPDDIRHKEFSIKAPFWWSYRLWLFFLRFVTPVGLILVFLNKIGVI